MVEIQFNAPDHDYGMPHDMRKPPYDKEHCPPNCPYAIWRRALEAADPVVNRHTETPDDWRLLTHKAAQHFLESCCLTATPDAIEQLAEVFLPCLQIMCERGWDPRGGTWRKSGILGAMTDAKKKWERFWERTWKHGKRHDDSGFDLINYIGFVMRSDPNSGWGQWGPPGVPEEERLTITLEEKDGLYDLPHPLIPFPDLGSSMPFKGFRISPSQLIWPDGPPDPMMPDDWRKLHETVKHAEFLSGEYPPPPPRGYWPSPAVAGTPWPAEMEVAGEEVPPLPRRIRPHHDIPEEDPGA